MVKTMMSMALPREGIKTVRQDQPDRAGLAAPAPGPQRAAREVVIPARLLVDGDSGARIRLLLTFLWAQVSLGNSSIAAVQEQHGNQRLGALEAEGAASDDAQLVVGALNEGVGVSVTDISQYPFLIFSDGARDHDERLELGSAATGAGDWLADHIQGGWASSQVIQHGCIRTLFQLAYPGALPPGAKAAHLAEAVATECRRFWPDSTTLLVDGQVAWSYVLGSRQLTDLYLLALAVRRGGRLVTFDRGARADGVRCERGQSGGHLIPEGALEPPRLPRFSK